MDESNRYYQHIRCVLENLTNELSDTPLSSDVAHELERSRTYLHDHCSMCGDAITGAEYAQIYEQECARVGAAGVASIEARPICLVCYAHLRRTLAAFAPSLLECPPIAPATLSLGSHAGAIRDKVLPLCPVAQERPDDPATRRAPGARRWGSSAAYEAPVRPPQSAHFVAQVLHVPGMPLAHHNAGTTLARLVDPVPQPAAKKVSHR